MHPDHEIYGYPAERRRLNLEWAEIDRQLELSASCQLAKQSQLSNLGKANGRHLSEAEGIGSFESGSCGVAERHED